MSLKFTKGTGTEIKNNSRPGSRLSSVQRYNWTTVRRRLGYEAQEYVNRKTFDKVPSASNSTTPSRDCKFSTFSLSYWQRF